MNVSRSGWLVALLRSSRTLLILRLLLVSGMKSMVFKSLNLYFFLSLCFCFLYLEPLLIGVCEQLGLGDLIILGLPGPVSLFCVGHFIRLVQK